MIDQLHSLIQYGLKHNANAIAEIVSKFKTLAEWLKFTNKFVEKYGYNPQNKWSTSKSLSYDGYATICSAMNFEHGEATKRVFK